MKVPHCTFVPFEDTQVGNYSAWNFGPRHYSIQLERIHISRRKFFRLYFNSQVRTRSWKKNKQRWKTNSFLRTSQSDVWEWSRRRMAKATTSRNREKNIIEASGNILRTLSAGFIQPERKTKDDNSGRHGRMLLMYTVLCHQNASTKLFLETVNEFYSRDSRRLDLHQKLYSKVLGTRSSSNSSSSKTLLKVHLPAAGNSLRKFWSRKSWKRIQATQQKIQKPLTTRKLLRSGVSNMTHVEEKPEFKVDLRIEGVAHDVILKDEEWMGQTHEEVGKLRKASYTKSIREDQRKPENYMIFSEESRRIIHELGNIELYELGQMSSTIQCHFCYKHMPEGLRICICGMCLRPDEDTISKIEARFKTLIVPHYFAHINRSRGEKCGESKWHKDHWKAVDATRGANKNGHDTVTIRWQADEQHREAQLAHGWTEEYFKYFDFPRRLILSMSHNLRPLHHLHKIGGNMNMSINTLNAVDTKTLHSEITKSKITNGKIMIGLKI